MLSVNQTSRKKIYIFHMGGRSGSVRVPSPACSLRERRHNGRGITGFSPAVFRPGEHRRHTENAGQCVGLVEVWIDVNKHPHIFGNAADLLVNADRAHYTVTIDGPANFPPMGAIVCWDGTWGGGYGHTAVVLAANAMQLVVFEQNDRRAQRRSSPRIRTAAWPVGSCSSSRGKNDESKVYG